MTFAGTTLDFVLSPFAPASSPFGTDCATLTNGESCVLSAGSPLLLTDIGGQTLISVAVSGTVTDGIATAAWHGTFTSQVTSSPEDVQTALCGSSPTCSGAGTGSIISTYSGQIGIVPEPALFGLTGGALGALALAGIWLRRTRRA